MNPHGAMLRIAEKHLAAACPHMRALISAHGPCRLQLQPDGFTMLVRSITSQQLSSTASRAIVRRLCGKLPGNAVSPAGICDLGVKNLRATGYSARKASYLVGLAESLLEGRIALEALAEQGDDDVVRTLTQVRGIGEWTAHMYLIFCLGRPDVLPFGDLGVRRALSGFHGLASLPGKRLAIELARPWRPYASVASWYCWRSADAAQRQRPA